MQFTITGTEHSPEASTAIVIVTTATWDTTKTIPDNIVVSDVPVVLGVPQTYDLQAGQFLTITVMAPVAS